MILGTNLSCNWNQQLGFFQFSSIFLKEVTILIFGICNQSDSFLEEVLVWFISPRVQEANKSSLSKNGCDLNSQWTIHCSQVAVRPFFLWNVQRSYTFMVCWCLLWAVIISKGVWLMYGVSDCFLLLWLTCLQEGWCILALSCSSGIEYSLICWSHIVILWDCGCCWKWMKIIKNQTLM